MPRDEFSAVRFYDNAGAIETKTIMGVSRVLQRLAAPVAGLALEVLLRLDQADAYSLAWPLLGLDGDLAGFSEAGGVSQQFLHDQRKELRIDLHRGIANVHLPINL